MLIGQTFKRAGQLIVAALFLLLLQVGHATGAARLGRDVMPTFQRIELWLDADSTVYSGRVQIELDVRETCRSFRLNAEHLEIVEVALYRQDFRLNTTYSAPDSTLLEIASADDFEAGPHRLEIRFTNNFDTRATGLYRVARADGSYTFTQMEADEAREAFPCFDEPAFKFPYQFVLTVPEAHIAVSNMPVLSESVEGGRRRVTFAVSPPMPSYLLAAATGPFETVDVPGISVPARILTTRGKIGMAGEAQAMTPPLLAALEEYFGSTYPYPKLDLIAVPEFWPGAMENPGAIMFTEEALLLDPASGSIGQKRRIASTMAHELAHMWFGDLVTMEWWDDLWLNESFATWIGNKITHQVFPGYGVDVDGVQSMQGTMRGDARPSSRPIRQPIDNVSDLLGNIGPINTKGQAVLNMFEVWVGEDAFREGIRAYLRQHAWGNARGEDLFRALSDASGRDIGRALSTFVEQPGVPLVKVEHLDGGRLRLSQSRFTHFGVEAPPYHPWQIPVTLKFAASGQIQSRTFLLTEPRMDVDLGTDGLPLWILPHGDARGYYQWLMPAADMIATARNAPSALTSRERVGFLGNLTALLDAGVVAGDEYLETVRQFGEDPDPQVISSVIDALEKVKYAFVTDTVQADFAAYVRQTLGPSLERYGREPVKGEAETVSLLRPLLVGWLADEGRDQTTLDFVRRQFDAFMADPSSVDPGLVNVSISLSCRNGDRALYEECRRRFEAADASMERGRYLAAIASFRDPAIQEENLRYTLDGPLRAQERFTIPGAIASIDDEHADGMFEWLMTNYDAFTSLIPPQYKTYMPFFASGCSRQRLARAEEFFSQPEHKAPGMDVRLDRLSDSVEDCVTLREREGAKVAAYLKALTVGAR